MNNKSKINLTKRELEVVEKAKNMLTNKEIADICLSPIIR